MALPDPVPEGEVGARVMGRHLAVARPVLDWANQHGITTGGRLLAAFELQPTRATQGLGWSLLHVGRAVRQLQDLFSRMP